jgi:hypothetical protein
MGIEKRLSLATHTTYHRPNARLSISGIRDLAISFMAAGITRGRKI